MALATIEECTAYADGSLQYAKVWEDADEQAQQRALETATRHIKATPMVIVPSTVPDGLKEACCEEALYLLSMDSDRLSAMIAGVQSRSAGDASESYSAAAISAALGGHGVLSPVSKKMLLRYRQGAGIL